MVNQLFWVLVLNLLMMSSALAEQKRIAVLEFRGVRVEQPILLKLSDQSRISAVELLDKEQYLIMTRENMMQILSDMGTDASCLDGQCAVEIARNIGADLIVTGDVMQIGETYLLTLKLHDAQQGSFLGGENLEASGLMQLIYGTKNKTTTLLSKGLQLQPPTRTVNIDTTAVVEQEDFVGPPSPMDFGLDPAMVQSGSSKPSVPPKEIEGEGYLAKLIPAGHFTMGCTPEQTNCHDNEKPTHKVTLSKDFYMMESEVTQALFQRVMGFNLSHFKGTNRPVEQVDWIDVIKFSNALSALEGLEPCYQITAEGVFWEDQTCRGWRLPTEAEWEYSARGNEPYQYAGSSRLDGIALYADNSNNQTHDVCSKRRNGLGLCDMSGNVWEWVWDWKGTYSSSPTVDPRGPDSGSYRVRRGGSWYSSARSVRVSNRGSDGPTVTNNNVGFRLCRTP